MPDLTILDTAQARALLTLSRASLWRWYLDCQVPLTGAPGGAIGWDRAKLLERREQLARQRFRARRERARQIRIERAHALLQERAS